MAHITTPGLDRSPGYVNPDTRAIQIARHAQTARRNDTLRQAIRVTGGCWLRPEFVADMGDHREDDS